MRGVVRASINTAWFLQMRAEVAGSGFLLDDGLFAADFFRIICKHFKGMQVDIAVGAIARAEPAADAPIFDNDFERIAAANRSNRATNHAKRVAALAATGGDEIAVKAQAVPDQPRDAVMRVGAGVHTSIAACAILQVEN